MSGRQIIMNFSAPPSLDDLEVLAGSMLDSMPEELTEYCESIAVQVEELPDEALEAELDLDDPFDLLILYKSGKEISPGVVRKTANDDDVLILFRRPILDLWCESGEDLSLLVRTAMVEELGRHFEFSDDDIEEMSERHYQGML